MKKLLTLFVAFTAVMFGLVSCGGGDDAATAGMSMQQFKNGSRQFKFNGATQLVVYTTGTMQNANNTDFRASTEGVFRHAAGTYPAELVYTITNVDADGNPAAATLDVTFTDQTLDMINGNQDLISDLGLGAADDNGDGGDELAQAPVHFVLNYVNWTATCTVVFRAGDAGDEGGEGGEGGVNNVENALNFNLYIQPVGA